MVSIPLSNCLSIKSALRTKQREQYLAMLNTGAGLQAEDIIAALILYESSDPNSHWADYFRSVPAHVPLPLYFHTGALAELQDSELARSAVQRRQELERSYTVMQPLLAKLFSHGWAALENGAARQRHFSLDRYLWAHALLKSRSMPSPLFQGGRALVPIADMFNYAPNRNNAGSFSQFHYIDSTSAYQVLADRAVAAGEQLFDDYGQYSNRDILENHGFVLSGNPNDCIELPSISSLTIPCSWYSIEAFPMLSSVQRADGAAVRGVELCASANQMFPCDLGACRTLRERQCEMSPDLWKQIDVALESKLTGFPTTLDQDLRKIAKFNSVQTKGASLDVQRQAQYLRLAVQYRSEQKQLIHSLMEWARSHTTSAFHPQRLRVVAALGLRLAMSAPGPTMVLAGICLLLLCALCALALAAVRPRQRPKLSLIHI